MQRVLVTGATGFIGFEVARELAGLGMKPRLMVRRPERGRLLTRLDAEVVFGDLTRPATLERATAGVDTVIHLGARATFEHYARVRPTIVDGSLALMEAAKRAGVERFVMASSLFVYGGSQGPIDAQTPPRPRLGYGRAKVEAEEALRRAAPPEMKLAIVRLPHVYGVGSFLFDRIKRGTLLFPGAGDNLYAHLHVNDAARILIEAGSQGWSGTSPVADDSARSWQDLFAVLRAHYSPVRLLRLPAPLAIAGATALETLTSLSPRPTLFTADTVRGWLLDLPVEPRLLWKDLGIEPRFPTIDEGIPACLDEAVAFRWLHPVADRSRG